MQPMIVEAHCIRKTYGAQPVLDELDLRVGEGTVAALLGTNGAGKTTLVRILTTLIRPDSGRATIAGHDVVREAQAVRSVISLTGQSAALDEQLTGEENLLLAARLWKTGTQEGRLRTQELLERFELTGDARKPVKAYSGGMRRKLDLAFSLMGRPRVLFLDEPTTGLDPRSRNALWEIVREMTASGVTVLLTTQYLEEADQLADRITMIDQGRVIAEGAADDLKRQIAQDVVELWFPDEEALIRAHTMLTTQPSEVASSHSLRVTTDGSASHIHHVLDELRHASVPIEKLSVYKPTLDDVFLSMTGTHPVATEARS